MLEEKTIPATEQAYGTTKLSDASDVTQKMGLALPSTEKNASMSGTLANQISLLENKLNPVRYVFSSSEITNGLLYFENSVTKFFGGICAINISVAGSAKDKGNILTIPEGFRPKYSFDATASGNDRERVILSFSKSGEVSIYSSEGFGAFGMFFYLSE